MDAFNTLIALVLVHAAYRAWRNRATTIVGAPNSASGPTRPEEVEESGDPIRDETFWAHWGAAAGSLPGHGFPFVRDSDNDLDELAYRSKFPDTTSAADWEEFSVADVRESMAYLHDQEPSFPANADGNPSSSFFDD